MMYPPQYPAVRTQPSTRSVAYGGIGDAEALSEELLSNAEVQEIAEYLLCSVDDRDRDHAINAMITHAAGRAEGEFETHFGEALGGLLKSLGRRCLPPPLMAGTARPPARVTTGAPLGVDTRGLSEAKAEFEIARRFVQLGSEAVRNIAEYPDPGDPRAVAAAALEAATHAYTPGVLSVPGGPATGLGMGSGELGLGPMTGRWPARYGAAELEFESFVYDPETEYFLGSFVSSVGRGISRAAQGAVKAVGRIPIVRDVARAAGNVATAVDKAASTIGRIPIVGDIARGALGVVRTALGPTAIAIDAATRLARGENLGNAFKGAVRGQIDAVRDQLKLAQMVAPFVPGIGPGIGAALGAANALANGQPITEAVMAAARSALPGGAIAQFAFDTAVGLAQGKNIAQAGLEAARNRLPGGPAARAAFDAALALAQGKKLQDAAFAAAGHFLPKSPFAADALTFVQRVANGQNPQHAALSVAGQRLVQQARTRAGVIRREMEMEALAA
jgi:hypothetical protein